MTRFSSALALCFKRYLTVIFLLFFITIIQAQKKAVEPSAKYSIPAKLPENGIVERLISEELLAKYAEADGSYRKQVIQSDIKNMYIDKNKLEFINKLNIKHSIKDENLNEINKALGNFLSPDERKKKMINDENSAKQKESELPKSVDAINQENN